MLPFYFRAAWSPVTVQSQSFAAKIKQEVRRQEKTLSSSAVGQAAPLGRGPPGHAVPANAPRKNPSSGSSERGSSLGALARRATRASRGCQRGGRWLSMANQATVFLLISWSPVDFWWGCRDERPLSGGSRVRPCSRARMPDLGRALGRRRAARNTPWPPA